MYMQVLESSELPEVVGGTTSKCDVSRVRLALTQTT